MPKNKQNWQLPPLAEIEDPCVWCSFQEVEPAYAGEERWIETIILGGWTMDRNRQPRLVMKFRSVQQMERFVRALVVELELAKAGKLELTGISAQPRRKTDAEET